MHNEHDDLADALHELSDGLPVREADSPQHGDRPCPICGALMLVDNLNGAEIDTCPDHGIWLDHDELHAVLASTKAAGKTHRVAMKRIAQAKQDGKVSGTLLGFWSLLLPE